jgi:hypothetical protein
MEMIVVETFAEKKEMSRLSLAWAAFMALRAHSENSLLVHSHTIGENS